MAQKKEQDLRAHLQQIEKIVAWFESQEEIDLEKALEKVKEAEKLIKVSKIRLAEIDNEFKEIEKRLSDSE